jgi:hypothetical protein
MPEAPLTAVEAAPLLPDSQYIDLSQEPSFALITTSAFTGQIATPAQYGYSGQDLVYGDYSTQNPGSQVLNVLCATTSSGPPTSIELLGTITNPHIIIPQQDGTFDSGDPFFIADSDRTYFVLPQYRTISSSARQLRNRSSATQWYTDYVFQTFYHP